MRGDALLTWVKIQRSRRDQKKLGALGDTFNVGTSVERFNDSAAAASAGTPLAQLP
jgi:hypothetical protein